MDVARARVCVCVTVCPRRDGRRMEMERKRAERRERALHFDHRVFRF